MPRPVAAAFLGLIKPPVGTLERAGNFARRHREHPQRNYAVTGDLDFMTACGKP